MIFKGKANHIHTQENVLFMYYVSQNKEPIYLANMTIINVNKVSST